ncbi:MAG TPA: LuxR C-terminal-related transcriptional regulator [Anaerolineales bacterium]|nr:LuxR C-terminal-related transcriptional regulator [Anaerolineales bacterium]
MSEIKSISSHNPERLLHTKLMPPRLTAAVVSRDDLLARLDEGFTKKVILVTAPTGFGKTTLVRMWISERVKAEGGRMDDKFQPSSFRLPPFSFAWLTVDEHDNDPVRFWTYACSALRTVDPSLGKATLSMLTSPQPPAFESLLTPLINDLTRLEKSSVLVLEDYHTIKSNEINAGVSFLIQHLPEALHLVFITRTDPDLPLGILRARDELVEINTTDLRFNQEQTEAFLHTTLKIAIPTSAVTRLLQKTEGWPAGLRLVTLLLQNKRSTPQSGSADKSNTVDIEKLIEAFSGSDRYVSDYLINEVFGSQTQDIQSFLLKTSFFGRLTGSLCDAILEIKQSAAILTQLERENLFIVQLERGGDQIWYRYNPLFAESLQHIAKQRLAETEIKSLFEKAVDWYEYHGLFDEAIETALAAKLFERAIALIERFIEIHDLRELRTLGRWLENIPQLEILRHPIICFTYAQVILYSSDRFAPATAARIEPFLRAAESAWQDEEDHDRLGQLLSFRGNVAWWQGEIQKAFEYSRQALDKLPEQDVFWRGNSLLSVSYEALSAGRILEAQDKTLEARALLGAVQNIYGVLAATQFLAEIFYWQGELEQAEQLNRQIQREAVGDESMLDDQGIAALNLGHIAYERNELDQAEELAARALDLAEQRANQMLQVQATSRLAHIHLVRGDSARALELLKSLEAKIQNPALLREIQNVQALLSIRSNDISSLEWWLKIISSDNQNALPLQKERETFALARLRIAEGKPNEVLDLLKQCREDAAQNGRLRSQVEALCLEALACYADGNVPEAAKLLSEALTIGQAKGFRRLFLDEGTRMAALLQAMLSSLPNRSLHMFAATLLHSLPSEVTSSTVTDALVEALSQQELRVLRLLAAGLSNADIARELVVSTNTIKTHVKSIYRKLNVNSRDEARTIARELKLL